MAQAVIANPSAIGIGLGEDTGVIITNGNHLEATGSGAVIILDGRNIKRSNIADIDEGQPIAAEGLLVHIMEMGNRYNTQTRKMEMDELPVPPAE